MSLTEDAKAAKAAKMTYGKWMAQKKGGEPRRKAAVSFARQIVCVVCGKPLRGSQRRYCCNSCACKSRYQSMKGGGPFV